jgi:S1-C subfamily serine protease
MESFLTIIYGNNIVYNLAELLDRKMYNYQAQSGFILLFSVFVLICIVHQQIALAFGVTSDHPSSLNELFQKVEGSVVQITSKVPSANPTGSQQPGVENQTALGSGFVYDRQGHIVTNSHVVGEAKSVDITSIDGNRYTANVTGRDPYSDLAVLKILNPNSNNTQKLSQFLSYPLVLGNSSELEVGDQVVAIGNPYGLDNTMTTGIVSQVGRAVQAPVGGYSIPDVLQTDAALNPGNSGGPLFNIRGQVVGVTFGGIPGGINFAVPSDIVRHIVPVLIDKGNYTHPYLGLKVATLTSDLASRVGKLPPNLRGIFVDTILRGGSADKAGIEASITDQYGKKHGGDIITAIDGKNITRSEDMISYLEKTKSPGNPVSFTIYRAGKFINLETTVGSRPSIK